MLKNTENTGVEMTAKQQSVVNNIQRNHAGCAMTTRTGKHGYVEVDVWTREKVKVYEVSSDGRYSRLI